MLPANTLQDSSGVFKYAALVDISAYRTETYSGEPCYAASQKMLKPVVFEITGSTV